MRNRLAALVSICLLANSNAGAGNLIGADRQEGTAFLEEKFSSDEGVRVNGCIGYGKNYIFVVGNAERSAYLFEVTADHISNVATVELTADRAELIEAMGGLWTYSELQVIIDQLASAPFQRFVDFGQPFSEAYLSQMRLECTVPPEPVQKTEEGPEVLKKYLTSTDGIFANGCKGGFELNDKHYKSWTLLVAGRKEDKSYLIYITDSYFAGLREVELVGQGVQLVGGTEGEYADAIKRAAALQLKQSPFRLVFDFDRLFSDEFLTEISLQCEIPERPK